MQFLDQCQCDVKLVQTLWKSDGHMILTLIALGEYYPKYQRQIYTNSNQIYACKCP